MSSTTTCTYSNQSGDCVSALPKRPSTNMTMPIWYSECKYVNGLGLVLGRFPDNQCVYIPERCAYYPKGSSIVEDGESIEYAEINIGAALLQRYSKYIEINTDQNDLSPKTDYRDIGGRIINIANSIVNRGNLDNINNPASTSYDAIPAVEDYSTWQHMLSCFNGSRMINYPCAPATIPVACATDLESRASDFGGCSSFPYDYMITCAHIASMEDIQLGCRLNTPYIFRGWVKFINLNNGDTVILPLFNLDADVVRQIASPTQSPCGDIKALIDCIRGDS